MSRETPLILVVEDEPVVGRAAERIVTSEGLAIEIAGDAEAALTAIGRRLPDLVLADIMLPGASGLELLREVRALEAPPPVVMITGYATADNALRSFSGGAFDFVPKPFDAAELLGVVQRALRFARRRQPAAPGAHPDDRPEGSRQWLGRHSWALIDEDGSAVLGVGETVAGLMAQPLELELPAAGDHVAEGRALVRIADAEGLLHRVTSRLSGAVMTTNPRLAEDAALLDRDPLGEGWLVRLIPTRPTCNGDEPLFVAGDRQHRR